ncbi:uncharacterized protein LOC122935876 isoform X1 [Bufo gargarizans]|uniref:uncharacterized protein LOC122935876 isoform X1 n=1 Tax=Bufo gargarizans TaxID=30331 RepID=UPI001CF40975|nr:uncharacterized protein LOC122935876 isoform X1 [Bufo gargarizans]XP_044147722.1 uncharacterized protein LOC122935876 isoform X1 [Bufo gargarizans]XP_044147723.1 uncharacterized protein LOC122935876 isoform X1 [Bufo gargarizans]XP_044147724.1 uncharacterized protein LOC122935876 isoform X1 [Bufo gargarizans]
MSHTSDIVEASVNENTTRLSEAGSIPSLRSWTIPRLMAELSKRGIPFTASARKAELYRLLMSSASPQPQEEVSMATVQTSLAQIHLMLNNLTSSVTDIQSRLDTVESRGAVLTPPGPELAIPSTSAAGCTGSDSSRRNPPKRCPRPLYPQDCREEKLPENHQAEVKDEEEEETDLWGDQQGSDSREVPPRDVPVLCIPRTVQRRSSQRTIRIHPRFIRWRPDTKWIPISHMCNRSG